MFIDEHTYFYTFKKFILINEIKILNASFLRIIIQNK